MALYLLEPRPTFYGAVPSCAISSHPFATVCIAPARQFLTDGTLQGVQLNLNDDPGSGSPQAYVSCQLLDYLMRGNAAEEMCLASFCTHYKLTKLSRSSSAMCQAGGDLDRANTETRGAAARGCDDEEDDGAVEDEDGRQSDSDDDDDDDEEAGAGSLHERLDLQVFNFRPQHARHRTHGMRLNKQVHVTLLRNEYLPDRTLLLESDDTCEDVPRRNEQREFYGIMVLSLYKSFRQRSDLIQPGQTWWQACSEWLAGSAPEWVKVRILYAQETFVQKAVAALQADQQREVDEGHLALAMELDQADDNAREIAREEAGLDTDDLDKGRLLLPPPAETGLSDSDSETGSGLPTDIGLRNAMNMVDPAVISNVISGYAALMRERTALALPTNWTELSDMRGGSLLPLPSPPPGQPAQACSGNFYDLDFGMRLQRIENALVTRVTGPRPPVCANDLAAQRLQPMPSLAEVVASFNLNEKQTRMFNMLAVKVVAHILSLSADGPSDPFDSAARTTLLVRQDELRRKLADLLPAASQGVGITLCGGQAGTGKSRVLSAVSTLADKWGFPQCVCVCAFTGIAASLLGARTLNSVLRFGFNMIPMRVTEEWKASVRPIALLLVDEASMIGTKMLVAIERRLRAVWANTARQNVFMGGVHLALCGDMFQIPPVAARSLCCQAVPWDAGTLMWKENLRECVILTEMVRQNAGDPLCAILHALRRNDFESVMDQLNARVIGGDLPEPEDTVEVFYKNDDRTRKNIASTLAWHQKGHTVYRFLMQFVDQGKHLTRADKDRLRLKSEDELGDLPGKLDLAVGMPCSITQNLCVFPDKISNGVQGTVWGFQFPDGLSQQFKVDRFRIDGVEAAYNIPVDGLGHPVLPDYIFVQVPGGRFNFPSLPADVYPIAMYKKGTVSYTLTMADGSTKNKCTLVRQFPLVPAFAKTFHKVRRRKKKLIQFYY